MKQKILSGILGLALVVLGLVSAVTLWAQDDSTEKKDETVAVEPPAESPASARESDDENKRHVWRDGKDVVMVGNDFLLKEDEVAADVVVVSGNATIKGRVSGDLVVVAGSAKVLGTVDGDMSVVLGSATLGPEAEVRRDAVVVGGTMTRDPGAKIGGTPTVVSTLGGFPDFEWLKAYTV